MYICAELENDVCVHWIDFAEFFAFPEGLTGIQVGAMFFGVVAAAWCAKQIARLILNNWR